jgi:hypothetical protein
VRVRRNRRVYGRKASLFDGSSGLHVSKSVNVDVMFQLLNVKSASRSSWGFKLYSPEPLLLHQ